MFRTRIIGNQESLDVIYKNYGKFINFENGNYYLECPQFQSMNTDEILPFAQKKVQNMVSLLNIKLRGQFNAEVDCIEDIKQNGTKSVILVPMTATVKLKANMPTIKIENKKTGKVEIFDPQVVEENLESYLTCIENNKEIQKALNLFNEDNNWNNLFNVYEIIREDMGSKSQIVNKGWATSSEIDIFTCTAHNVGGGGKRPRHAIPKINPNCQRVLSSYGPMELSTAINLINGILSNWIDYRCP